MGKSNYDKIRERIQQRQAKQADADDRWWKPGEGKHRFRILPPPDGFDMWYFEYGVHYGLTTEDGGFQTITCPRLTIKKPCPICEFTRGLWKSGTDADKQLARKMGAKSRAVSNVVVYDGQKASVKLWGYPATPNTSSVLQQLEELCYGADGSINPIDDPQKGVNLKLTISMKSTGEGKFPNYMVSPEIPATPIQDKSVLTNLHNFVEIITSKVRSYDEIRSLLMGSSPEADLTSVPSTQTVTSSAPSKVEKKEEPAAPAPEASTDESEEEVIEETSSEVKNAAPAESEASRPSQSELVARARAALAKRK